MTEWIFVRHGATEWNRDGRYQGHSDSPLSAEGLAQSRQVAGALAGRTVEAVYSSDLQRARSTADVIARPHDLPVHLDERLREIGLGEWEGMQAETIAEAYPDAWQAIQQDPVHARAPFGESVDEVAQRMLACLRSLAARHPHGPIVVVSHGLALSCVLCLIDGIPLDLARQRIPPNCAAISAVWP